MEFWYCGWCKNGPMAIKLSEVCFSCARIRDASATYGSSDRIESSKAAGSKVRKEGSSPSVTGATPIQNPSPDETLISQSRRPSEQSESKDYSSQCADERRVDIAYDSGLREFGSIENVSAETADSGNLPAPLPFSTSAHPSAPSHTAAGLPTAPPKRKAFSVPYISPTVEVNPTAPSPLLHEGYSAGRFRPSQYQIEHTYRGYAPIQIEPGQTEAMIQYVISIPSPFQMIKTTGCIL
ncbi:MAG: hypothetical protein L6R42_000133 [Xanthoria sp. 1 TBL-2021]|nr:MAG: hypothetical protein L6R42_000133 [Xanthoria sp. 1 TBL-2021]